MSTKSGFQSTTVQFVAPAAASGAVYSNGGLAITSLKAGKYLVILNFALDPVNVGANITGSTGIVTQTALFGAVGAIALCQLQVSAANAADINSRHSCSNIVTLAADASIFLYLSATVSAGNWQSSTSLQDINCNDICFIKLE
jgi:hypothetical protein